MAILGKGTAIPSGMCYALFLGPAIAGQCKTVSNAPFVRVVCFEGGSAYPLPEAQVDRFLMHVYIDHPDESTEREIVSLVRAGEGQVQVGSIPNSKAGLDRLQRAVVDCQTNWTGRDLFTALKLLWEKSVREHPHGLLKRGPPLSPLNPPA